MTDWPVRTPPDELVTTHALEKLRVRAGLTRAHLSERATEAAAPLLNLYSVRRYATSHDVDLPLAAHAIISECVRENLSPTNGIIADAVLALGVFSDAYSSHGISPRDVRALSSDLLSRRRQALLANWGDLHESRGVPPPEAPSDRSLRGAVERHALAELARQLLMHDARSLVSRRFGSPQTTDGYANRTEPAARVVVVGGAMMDAAFRIKTLPPVETSREADDFNLLPGGKGLTQAVAAARLGLDVSLIAAVADDHFGYQIMDYLQRERVDTSMIKMIKTVPHARTPFVGVIELDKGASLAVNWRNDKEVYLDIEDIAKCKDRLHKSDAVLITFEPPRTTVQRTLDLIYDAPVPRPITIVTPSQPYTDQSLSGKALAQIDFLVAHLWELTQYVGPVKASHDDAASWKMLAYGVETLCILAGGGCTTYSASLGKFSVPIFPSPYNESAAARDAFCAALAVKLIEHDKEFSEPVALWATAAMAAARTDYPLRNSMPDRTRVDRVFDRSRFTVATDSRPAVLPTDPERDP